MENKENDFYENLFGTDRVSNKDEKEDSEDTAGSLFDMNAGKTFIGIGDIKENERKSARTILLWFGGGFLLIVMGLAMLITKPFWLGLILIGIGAFLIYGGQDSVKTKCPECARADAMKVIYSEDLAITENRARFKVYENYKHKQDEVDVNTFTTAHEYEQCCFCGYTRSVFKTKKTGSQTYIDK